MFGLSRYAIVGLLAVVVTLGGTLAWQRYRINALVVEAVILRGKLLTCDARIENILEARESDAVIDNIDDLSVSPNPDWLQPGPADQ